MFDLERTLQFPSDVTLTRLRPDVVILSRAARIVIMDELTVPWEDIVEGVHERKKEKYEELVSSVSSMGGGPTVIPLRWGAEGLLHSQQCLFSVAWVLLEKRRGECVRG